MTEEGRGPDPTAGPESPRGSLMESMNNYMLLIYAASCFLMYSSLASLLYGGGLVVLSLSLPSLLGIVFPLLLLARRFSAGVASEWSLARPGLMTTAAVLLVTAGSIIPAETLTWLFERNRPVNDDYIRFLLAIKPKGIVSLISLGLGIAVVSPFGEELLFRGFLQRIFQRNFNGALAVALAACAFGLSHFSIELLAGVTWFGVVLGYIYLRTGNLFYPFISHALYNLVSLARLNASNEETIRAGASSHPPAEWLLGSLAVLAGSVALMEILRRRGKKKDEDPRGPSS